MSKHIKCKVLAIVIMLAACTQPQIILPPSLGGPHAMAVARGEVCMDTIAEDDNVFVPGIRACREGERGAIGFVVNNRINRVAVVDMSQRSPLLLDLDPGTPGLNHIAVGERPVDIAVSGDGTVATTADELGRTLTRIDVWSLKAVGEAIKLPGAPRRVLTRPGASGQTLALLTDNPALWVQPAARCESSGTCQGLDARGQAFALPANPADMIVEPDGAHAWVIYVDRPWASVVRLEDTGEACLSGAGVVCEVARVGLVHPCMDGLDNDGDGRADSADPQCWGPLGAESGAVLGRQAQGACADGLDNDGDGLVDRDDPECLDPSQADEATPGVGELGVCADGRDNDGDGRLDRDDPGCYGSQGRTEVDVAAPGFERMGMDPAGIFAYVVDSPRSQILVLDLARRTLVDGPRSQEPRGDVFNQQLGVTVGRAPTAVTGRVRRRVIASAADAERRGVIKYDLGAYAISDNGQLYYVDAMTVDCLVAEPDSLLTSDEFNARGSRWATSRERRCLEGLPALPLEPPAVDVLRCDQVVVCASCQQRGGRCEDVCDNVVVDGASVAACQLGHRREDLGDGVIRVVNPSFGLLDRFARLDGGQLGRATCEQPAAQIEAVQRYVSQNPGYRGTQDCGSVILPQPLALDVPTSAGVRPFDLLDAARISPLERRTLQLDAESGEPVVVLGSYDERMRDETWVVEYEGVLPATVRTDGLIDAAQAGLLLTGQDLCEAGLRAGDVVTITTGPGTETGRVPAECEVFVGAAGATGFLSYEVVAVRPNGVELGVIAGEKTAQALPTRACFPRGLAWSARVVGQWLVSGETSGVVSDRRAQGGACVAKQGAESGRLSHRVKTGEVYKGPYFELRLYAGLVEAVRGLKYTVRLVRNFSASALETRQSFSAQQSPRTSRATQVLYEEVGASRRFLLVLDPSDGLVYGVNLGTGDGPFLLQ